MHEAAPADPLTALPRSDREATAGTLQAADWPVDAGIWEDLVAGSEGLFASAGTLLFEEQTIVPLLAILEGVVRVYIRTDGGRQATLRYARAGDLVGLSAALSPRIRATAEAVTDVTVAVVPLERLQHMLASDADLAWPIAMQMARWGSEIDLALVDLEHRPMTARVAGHLLEAATTDVGGVTRARVSQKRLAAAVGTVREVATRSIAELRDAGIVLTVSGTVVIADRARLSRIARGGSPVVEASPRLLNPVETRAAIP